MDVLCKVVYTYPLGYLARTFAVRAWGWWVSTSFICSFLFDQTSHAYLAQFNFISAANPVVHSLYSLSI